MLKYHVQLLSSTGKMIEVLDFLSGSDAEACGAVEMHIALDQRAKIWRKGRLLREVFGTLPSLRPVPACTLNS